MYEHRLENNILIYQILLSIQMTRDKIHAVTQHSQLEKLLFQQIRNRIFTIQIFRFYFLLQ